MTGQPEQPQPDLVQHARRFTARHQGVAMHGVLGEGLGCAGCALHTDITNARTATKEK